MRVGPYHSTNPDGLGDAVSDNVDFDPWLTKPVVEGAGVSAKLKCRSVIACITPPPDYAPKDIVGARIVTVDGVDCVVEGELVTERHRCRTRDYAVVKFNTSDIAACLSGETLVGKEICVEADLSDGNVTCPTCTVIEEYCDHGGMR